MYVQWNSLNERPTRAYKCESGLSYEVVLITKRLTNLYALCSEYLLVNQYLALISAECKASSIVPSIPYQYHTCDTC